MGGRLVDPDALLEREHPERKPIKVPLPETRCRCPSWFNNNKNETKEDVSGQACRARERVKVEGVGDERVWAGWMSPSDVIVHLRA